MIRGKLVTVSHNMVIQSLILLLFSIGQAWESEVCHVCCHVFSLFQIISEKFSFTFIYKDLRKQIMKLPKVVDQ